MCHKRGIKARIYDDKLSSHLSGVSGIVVVPIEKVASPGFLLFVRNLQAKKALARFVVDEAHSVLTQGHFREAMQDLKHLRTRTNTRDVPITIPCGFCYLLYRQSYSIWHPYYLCPLVQPNMCRVCLAEAADHRGDNCGHAWKANKDNSRKRFQPRGTLHGSTCFRCGGPNENGKCFMGNFFLEIWIGLWRIDSQLNFGLIASLEQSLAKGESGLRDLSRWILWGYAPSPHYQGWNMCLVILVVACEYSLERFQQQSPAHEYYYSSSCDSDGMPARVRRKRVRG